jgi:7-carboxy-7-deazaguanine synthase
MLRIAEIFRSLQGEGLLTGTPSVFVRVSGCNLRCGFCDTPYASWRPEGDSFRIDEILDRVLAMEEQHVVITGGEPMLFADLVPLAQSLRQMGRHITIETAGTVDQPVACDLMSISPKLANSTPRSLQGSAWFERHEQTRYAPNVIRRLLADYDCQLKFVVDSPDACREMEAYVAEFPELARDRILLMPEGIDPQTLAERTRWLEPYCDRQGVRFCPRKHIEWFGVRRGA